MDAIFDSAQGTGGERAAIPGIFHIAYAAVNRGKSRKRKKTQGVSVTH